jgi:hypothetical protein
MNLLERNVRYLIETNGEYGRYGLTPAEMSGYLGSSDPDFFYAFTSGRKIVVYDRIVKLVEQLKNKGIYDISVNILLTEPLGVKYDKWNNPIYYDQCPEGDYTEREEKEMQDVFDSFIWAMGVLNQ